VIKLTELYYNSFDLACIVHSQDIGTKTTGIMLEKICFLSKDMRFNELCKVLEAYGYKMHQPKGGSSHYIFRKEGCRPVTIPKHEPVKKVYVEMVKKIVESEAGNYDTE
jgi:Predicted periplasmic or secreted lipoprotein